MKISSPSFCEGESIPSRFTCQGKNISPPLTFQEIPIQAKSLVLLMDDPDVPPAIREDQMWDHWVVFNIPPHVRQLAEGEKPPGIEGLNTWGQNCYGGPCPPDREHRYFFHLYALDTMLKLSSHATKKEVEEAMEHHLLAQASLMGLYQKC